MKKITLLLLSLVFIFLPSISLAKIDDSNINSVVQIKVWDTWNSEYIATGSGVFIEGSTVLTNYHVVEDAIINPKRYTLIVCTTKNSLSVSDCRSVFSPYLFFGYSFHFDKPQGYIKELDLAIIGFVGMIENNKIISSFNMTFAEYQDLGLYNDNIKISIFGEELTGIKVGDQVQTLGYPGEGGNTITYSNGAVTNFEVNKDGRVLAIITSARITPGSSGGAAFDSFGKFIGVTSAMYADSSGNFISGVIIPVSTVNWWLKEVQGYRVQKDGEYTTLPEGLAEAVLCKLDGKPSDAPADWDSKCATIDCKEAYGENVFGKKKDDNSSSCFCLQGYVAPNGWNTGENACVLSDVKGDDANIITENNTIFDGDIIQNPSASGDAKFDVYIVKLVGVKKFKRLVLNPQVFASYGHLKWENIKKVTTEEMVSYKTSALVKVEGDPKVLALAPNGDIGSKSWLNVPGDAFIAAGGDWDSVYQINAIDGANYKTNTDFTNQPQVVKFLTTGILPTDVISSNSGLNTASAWNCGDFVSYSGQDYKTVQIGSQCWFQENLNVGVKIAGVSNLSDNGVIEKYCYDDNATNCTTDGGLYQWYEVMAYSITEGAQGICPSGWHIPKGSEWYTLENYLGTDIAGAKLKANGSSGFESVLAGRCFADDGSFDYRNTHAFFWSSSGSGADAWRQSLNSNYPTLGGGSYDKAYGFSVRCLRD